MSKKISRSLRVAYLSHLDMNLFLFRSRLIKTMLNSGCKVYAFSPKGKYSNLIEKAGATFIEYSIDRRSYNPFNAIFTILEIARLLKRNRIDMLHSFTFKPNIFGSIAGRLARVPVIINHVTGLGFLYTENNLQSKIMRCISNVLYRISFSLASHVIFQNFDDADALKELYRREKGTVIVSSGVDVDVYDPKRFSEDECERIRSSLSIQNDQRVITIIARLIWHKGIFEFIDAAKRILSEGLKCIFLVVGWVDKGNPASLPNDYPERNDVEEIKFLGQRDDIPGLLSITDVYVLPSYREGTPRSVLEAMAMGKPVVTTDVPGCRETVVHGESGYIVPVMDSIELAAAIRELISDPEKRTQMGRAARRRTIELFSDMIVNRKIIRIYTRLLGEKGYSEESTLSFRLEKGK